MYKHSTQNMKIFKEINTGSTNFEKGFDHLKEQQVKDSAAELAKIEREE